MANDCDEMDSLGSMVMLEALLATRAFDQQGPWPIKLLVRISI